MVRGGGTGCVCVSQGSRRGVGGARVHFYFLIISAFSVSSWPTLHKLVIYRFQCRFGVISVIFAAGLCSKRVVSRRWRWFSSRLRSFSGGLEEQPGLRLFSVNCIRLIFISSLSIWGDCVSPFCILMTGFVFCCAMYMDKTSVLRGKNPFFLYFIFYFDILKRNVVFFKRNCVNNCSLSICNVVCSSAASYRLHHHGRNIIHACSIVQCVSV